MDKYEALVAEAKTGTVEENYGYYEESFMASVCEAFEEHTGTYLEPSGQCGRGCVTGIGGDYDGCSYDLEEETAAMTEVLARGLEYEDAVAAAEEVIKVMLEA